MGGVLMALGREFEIISFPLGGSASGNLRQVKFKKKINGVSGDCELRAID